MNQTTAAIKAMDSIQTQLIVKLTDEQWVVVHAHLILLYGVGFNERHQDKSNARKVVQYKERKFIHSYNSISDAAKALSVHRRSIESAINRKGKCKGFTFFFIA